MSLLVTEGLGALGDGSSSTLVVTMGLGGNSASFYATAVSVDARLAQLTFNKVPTATVLDVTNYSVDNGLVISAVVLVTDTIYRIVTSRQTYGVVYTITINNVQAA